MAAASMIKTRTLACTQARQVCLGGVPGCCCSSKRTRSSGKARASAGAGARCGGNCALFCAAGHEMTVWWLWQRLICQDHRYPASRLPPPSRHNGRPAAAAARPSRVASSPRERAAIEWEEDLLAVPFVTSGKRGVRLNSCGVA